MVLCGHTDASYLTVSKARSRAVAYFFSDAKASLMPANAKAGLPKRLNGRLHVVCTVMKNALITLYQTTIELEHSLPSHRTI